MENNEQWIKGGNCSECRKANYCSKFCKEHSKRMDKKISEAFNNSEVGKMFSQVNGLLGKY